MAERLPLLDPIQQGRRLRQLRLLAQKNLEDVATALGYAKGGNSSLSLIERGKRNLNDIQRRKAANYLADQGELIDDPTILYRYMAGDHDSLDDCLDLTISEPLLTDLVAA